MTAFNDRPIGHKLMISMLLTSLVVMLLMEGAYFVHGFLSLRTVTAQQLEILGEITAANAESVWDLTCRYLSAEVQDRVKTIDLSQVRFIDSTGLGLMIRAKKQSLAREEVLRFTGLRPPVRNVVRLSKLEEFLLGSPSRGSRRSQMISQS